MCPSLEDLGINALSPPDRIDLIAAIWDSLDEDLASVPVPEWHRALLEERLAAGETSSNAGVPWEAVNARLKGSS